MSIISWNGIIYKKTWKEEDSPIHPIIWNSTDSFIFSFILFDERKKTSLNKKRKTWDHQWTFFSRIFFPHWETYLCFLWLEETDDDDIKNDSYSDLNLSQIWENFHTDIILRQNILKTFHIRPFVIYNVGQFFVYTFWSTVKLIIISKMFSSYAHLVQQSSL